MRGLAPLLAAAFLWVVGSPTKAADLVVWWQKGFNPEEDVAVREMIAAFEGKTGKRVELDFYPQAELPKQAQAALEAGDPPDFAFSSEFDRMWPQWAYADQLVDLTDTLGPFVDLFDKDMLDEATMLDARTGRRALYGLPMIRFTNHVHVWRSLLEQAGFRLEDIPREWSGFWSFWCDQVQPAVRKALGRQDVWGVGVAMSIQAYDTLNNLDQFLFAYTAEWPTPSGPTLLRDPAAREIFIRALTEYTDLYRKGCTPPNSATWTNLGNNEAFLAQRTVMTANTSLSIPGALRRARPQDYDENAVTLDWPTDASEQPLRLVGSLEDGVIFAAARHIPAAKDFGLR